MIKRLYEYKHVQASTNNICREYVGEGDCSVEQYAIGAYLASVAFPTSNRAELERYYCNRTGISHGMIRSPRSKSPFDKSLHLMTFAIFKTHT